MYVALVLHPPVADPVSVILDAFHNLQQIIITIIIIMTRVSPLCE